VLGRGGRGVRTSGRECGAAGRGSEGDGASGKAQRGARTPEVRLRWGPPHDRAAAEASDSGSVSGARAGDAAAGGGLAGLGGFPERSAVESRQVRRSVSRARVLLFTVLRTAERACERRASEKQDACRRSGEFPPPPGVRVSREPTLSAVSTAGAVSFPRQAWRRRTRIGRLPSCARRGARHLARGSAPERSDSGAFQHGVFERSELMLTLPAKNGGGGPRRRVERGGACPPPPSRAKGVTDF